MTPTCDLKTLSDLLSLTPRRLQQLATEGVVHKAGRGKYQFSESIKGYVAYLNNQVPNKVNSEDSTDNRALAEEGRAKLLSEKAIMANMERREMEANLIPAVEVKRDAATAAVNVRQSMMLIPDNLSPLLVEMTNAREIRTLLRREVTQSLTDVSLLIAAYAASNNQTEAEVESELSLLPPHELSELSHDELREIASGEASA